MTLFHPRITAAGPAALVYLRSIETGEAVTPESLAAYCSGLEVSEQKRLRIAEKLVLLGLWQKTVEGWCAVTLESRAAIEPKRPAMTPAERSKAYRDRHATVTEQRDDRHGEQRDGDRDASRDGVTKGEVGGGSAFNVDSSLDSDTESLDTEDFTLTSSAKDQGKKGTKRARNTSPVDAKTVQLPAHLDTESVRESLAKWVKSRSKIGKPYRDQEGLEFSLKPYLECTAEELIENIESSISGSYQKLCPAHRVAKPKSYAQHGQVYNPTAKPDFDL